MSESVNPNLAQPIAEPFDIEVLEFGTVQAQSGERLVLALERGGIDILHRCGGVAKCTTCLVAFEEGEPGEMTVAEYDKLTEKNLLEEGRLACQIECAPGMKLRVLKTVQSTGLEAGKAPTPEIQPDPQWTVRPGASTEG